MAIAVVVGGGCSGVLATRELLRVGWSVVLVDPGARPGRGLAYGTAAPWHLLNSPVGTMSADPDRPNDFLDWCRVRSSQIGPTDFVSRSWYGDYLSDVLREADRTAQGRLTVQRGRVARIFESSGAFGPTSRNPLTVLLADDVVIPADRVVLALGHAAPTMPVRLDAEVKAAPAYLADPWRAGALAALPPGSVLLIGTGLTAVDVALSLAQTGRQSITAVSRHGLLPQPHRRPGAVPSPIGPLAPDLLPTGSLSQLTRALRRLAGRSGDWRAVMDALRPHWDTLWQGLPEPAQHRFLRHLARYWEVHRHRMAPAVADAIAGLRTDGVLEVRAAELCGISPADGGRLRVVLRERRTPDPFGGADAGTGGIVASEYAAVINCTGPGRLVDSDPLVRSLVAEGMVRPGPYGLGLDVDSRGAALRRDGSVHPALWTVGPPRRGRLWETTAAPEIRAQARALAAVLHDDLIHIPARVDS